MSDKERLKEEVKELNISLKNAFDTIAKLSTGCLQMNESIKAIIKNQDKITDEVNNHGQYLIHIDNLIKTLKKVDNNE